VLRCGAGSVDRHCADSTDRHLRDPLPEEPDHVTTPLDTVTFAHGPAIKNRLMLAPLTNQQSHSDGTLSDDERFWLTMRAEGGFGLTMTCAAHVQARGQGFAGQLGIFDDLHLDGLRQLATELNATGTVSYVQLHHAGTRSPAELIGETPVAPSEDPDTGARALTTGEVEEVVEAFVQAAERADRAGFHGVELHGAHGYLLCAFLSPETNRRTDRYGGSPENRRRIIFEILDGIRARCRPDFAIGVRLSPERFGLVLDEIRDTYVAIAESGLVDLMDMSLWDVRKHPRVEGFEDRTLTEIFTELPRGAARLGVAGKIHDPADVAWVLDQGVDIAILGRVAILHHNYPDLIEADPGFSPRQAPVSPDVLRSEGLSRGFVDYLAKNFPGFVDTEA
jgi:2,4-dienoyl-CoA reductase-like NADH-dependent reductase (Old Yellow Enzyme family)